MCTCAAREPSFYLNGIYSGRGFSRGSNVILNSWLSRLELGISPQFCLKLSSKTLSTLMPLHMGSKDGACCVSFFFFLCAILSLYMFIMSVLGVLGRVFVADFCKTKVLF